MILDSRNSLCQTLDSQDSRPERAGKFPEIDEWLEMAVGALCQALAFAQVPAVMSRVQAKAGHMVLGVSLLIPPFTPTWTFLDLQEKVIALDVTGRAWPLTYHHAALWNEASAVSGLPGEGEGREEREGRDAWAINMEQFNCQALQFTSDLRSMANAMEKSFSTPLSSCYKIEYVINSMLWQVHGASVKKTLKIELLTTSILA